MKDKYRIARNLSNAQLECGHVITDNDKFYFLMPSYSKFEQTHIMGYKVLFVENWGFDFDYMLCAHDPTKKDLELLKTHTEILLHEE